MILHFVLSIYHIPINYFQASLKWKDWVIKFIYYRNKLILEKWYGFMIQKLLHIYISLDIKFLIMHLLLYFLVKKFDVKLDIILYIISAHPILLR